MNTRTKKNLQVLLWSALAALLVTLALLGGLLSRFDNWFQDALFQQPQYVADPILVIGIDETAIEEIGAYQTWDRNVMASALEALASDPEHLPAVVAIDTLYSGETDPEADARLAAACAALPRVVTATTATFGTVAADSADGIAYDHYHILQYEEPFEALRAVTVQGHINAMYDGDGILRHALAYVALDGRRVYSMAYQAARLYLESIGEEVTEPRTNSRGFFYVSYAQKPGGSLGSQYSIAKLIRGEVDPREYDGAVVFIGPYTVGLQDAYFTSIDHGRQMYGVEYQANVVRQIIDSDYKTEIADLPQAVMLFLICFLAFFLFWKSKVGFSSVAAVLLVGASAGASYLAYRAGYLLHPLWIPVGVAVLYLVSIGIHYGKSALEKQQVTRTFERYVAPEIVKEILKEGTENLSLGGKLCNIAVLFVDVRGFTTMSERLDPEKVVFILNRYLTMASGCVEANHGTLDKFVGDAMMAFWGAPLPQEDTIYNAVKTAQGIVEGARHVSEELKEEIGEELNVGVGVHYGPAVVGNMGSERHMDYTAIGDTVNTSARLEANAPGGCVYISRAVADALGDRITYTSLGDTVKLKGKAEGFEVLKLEGIR